MTCITLTTDFGIRDEYVGVMKGVIYNADPSARVIDITHGIGPQDVLAAAHTLKSAYRFFPEGSIHLAIVDPGVGTAREIIALPYDGHVLMAPNNGLLWPIIAKASQLTAYAVDNESIYRQPVSTTFHGRDIFAPAAAFLSRGGQLADLGSQLSLHRVKRLAAAVPKIIEGRSIEGVVVSVDRFGNLISNIHRSDLEQLGNGTVNVRLGPHTVGRWCDTYAGGKPGEPVLVFGSRECLEIAVNGASAADKLSVAQGTVITVRAGDENGMI